MQARFGGGRSEKGCPRYHRKATSGRSEMKTAPRWPPTLQVTSVGGTCKSKPEWNQGGQVPMNQKANTRESGKPISVYAMGGCHNCKGVRLGSPGQMTLRAAQPIGRPLRPLRAHGELLRFLPLVHICPELFRCIQPDYCHFNGHFPPLSTRLTCALATLS